MAITNYNGIVSGTAIGGFDISSDGCDREIEITPACTGTEGLRERSGLGRGTPEALR